MAAPQKTFEAQVIWPGREEATLRVVLDDRERIASAFLTGVGGPHFLAALRALRQRLTGLWRDVPLPNDNKPEDILLRELLLRARGEWNYPYPEDELCHCRAVPTAVVDQAICHGAHTSQKVSARTSASTACGTCRPNVEEIIRYRLKA